MILSAAQFLWSALLGLAFAFRVNAGEAAIASRQVEDLTGHTLTIPLHPQHVLSLCTTVTDTMVRLDAGGQIAGIDEYSRIVPGATNIAVLGKGSAISREQVLSRNIDLAFIWWFQDDVARMLADLGVPTVKIRCERADEVPAAIRLIGDCVSMTNAADQLAWNVGAQLATLRQIPGTNVPRVFAELYSPFKTAGHNSVLERPHRTCVRTECGCRHRRADSVLRRAPD